MEIDKMGNESVPSITKNPFSKQCITRLYVNYSKNLFSETWYASGCVEFKNGETKGEQNFKGANFDDVALQMKNYINSELK
jgi:hypothetical protein